MFYDEIGIAILERNIELTWPNELQIQRPDPTCYQQRIQPQNFPNDRNDEVQKAHESITDKENLPNDRDDEVREAHGSITDKEMKVLH